MPTTLELAQAIARAVLLQADVPPDEIDEVMADCARLVLDVLHQRDAWFCRLDETPDQGTLRLTLDE